MKSVILGALLASVLAFGVQAQTRGTVTVPSLPPAALPFDGSEILYLVQGGVSKQTPAINVSSGSGFFLPLTGGGLTGALTGTSATFSGVGTLGSLSVTNASTLHALTATTGAFSGALTLGAGGTGGQSIQASGTGNFLFTLGGSSSLFNFRSSAGTSILQVGGAGNSVSVQKQLVLPGGTWVGASTANNAALFSNSTWSGSPGGNISASLNQLLMSEGLQVGVGGEVNGLSVTQNTNTAGFTGQRHALTVIQGITAAPTGSGGTYTALNTKINASVNVGGTGLTALTGAGAVFGINPVAHLAPGATFWDQIVGGEFDVWAEAGSSVVDKIGLQIVDVTGSVVQGARDDVGFSLNNQYSPTSSTGWRIGIEFGRAGGAFPVSTIGTLIGGQGPLGAGFTIASGIDWSLGTATGNWLNLGGVFTVDGSGKVTAPAIGNASSALQISGSGQWSANGAVATTMTSLGPTGSHTTVQEWLTITDASGTTRYIPAY